MNSSDLTQYKKYITHYLKNRPLFFSFIRPQEALFFHQNNKLLKSKILDFGCGDGFFADMVFGKGTIDVGLDVKESRADEAKTAGIYKDVVYYDGYQIPFPDNHFQTVVSNCVLEHIPNVHLCIAEIYRVLKPGGHFLTSVMSNKWNDYLLGRKLLGKPYEVFMQKKQVHHNLFSLDTWTKEFTTPGFSIEKVDGYLSAKNSLWMDAAHYLSIPSLISHKLINKWVAFPGWVKTPGLISWIVNATKLPKKPQEGAALFFVLKK